METLIQFGGAVAVTVICVERRALRAVQNTVYMVRPKKERS
jgi:hypothetical protein